MSIPISTQTLVPSAKVREHIQVIAQKIGKRNVVDTFALAETGAYIDRELSSTGLLVTSQSYQAEEYHVRNIVAEIPGSSAPNEIVIVGAHYDTAPDSPGANDNGSGIASLLVLAGLFAGRPKARTIRFVAFTCEEDPFFQTHLMGSFQYAAECRKRRDDIRAMLSLETIGYYSNAANTQHRPRLLRHLLPSTANFLLFVSNISSRGLLTKAHSAFCDANTSIPAHKVWLPGWLRGPSASDQWSFWKHGYPAIMITDTANLRYPPFHTLDDTPEKLCYEHLADVIGGLELVVTHLSSKSIT
jgi:Zn-dependent M28 family amino/carboxypeptidase